MRLSVVWNVGLLLTGMSICSYGSPEMVFPDSTVRFLTEIPSTTNKWWETDNSMKSTNERIGDNHMIQLMGWGLLSEPFHFLIQRDATNSVSGVFKALYRGGDDPRITNILHTALLAPTNHYREATFRACVMASPVPMTFLAETVVRRIPAGTREQWYRCAAETAWHPSFGDRFFPPGKKPSREALRYAHFLYTAKQLETDPGCLTAIGNPIDPKRNTDKP